MAQSEGKFWSDQAKARCRQNKTANNIDYVVLVGQDRRKTDQEKPNHHRKARDPRKRPHVNVSQEHQQCGMQRRKKVVGRVHPAEPVKQSAEPSVGLPLSKRESERKREETNSGGNNGAGHPQRE